MLTTLTKNLPKRLMVREDLWVKKRHVHYAICSAKLEYVTYNFLGQREEIW